MEQIAEAIINIEEQLKHNNLCQTLQLLAIVICLIGIMIKK